MNKSDFPEFSAILDGVAGLLGKPTPPAVQLSLFFKLLEAYPLPKVRNALEAHLIDPQRGRFFPTPADVIEQMNRKTHSGWLESDEAWAIAIKASDENATVVWTAEMRDSYAVCSSLMQDGDKVGARMAFKACYERLMNQAKREGKAPSWEVSEGFDKAGRVAALEDASSKGLLMIGSAPALMLEHTKEVTSPPNEAVLARLKELKSRILSSEHPESFSAHQHTEALKRETREKVAQYRENTYSQDLSSR